MLVKFTERKLARLETNPGYSAGFGSDVVKAFRRRMEFIRAASDERDFRSFRSLHYEKLKGDRRHQRSMRLNDQFRLILTVDGTPERTVVIVSIEDYH